MKKIVVLASSLVFASVSAYVVDQIVFEGLDRVEEGALYDCLSIKPGKNFNDDDVDTTLKALFRKGFFSDVKLLRRKQKLVVQCVEKPMVDRVAFEGNEVASDDALKTIVGNRIGEGRLFSLHLIKDILADLQIMYRALGFYSVIVVPKLIRHPGNKVDVVFEIKEGSKTTVKKIIFIGNKSFSDDELKDIMSTKEEKIWRFWDYESHVFREDKVEVDMEAISSFYKNRGYPFFMITSSYAEMDFDKKSHRCTFIMEEGDLYHIASVSLSSEVPKVDAKEFEHLLAVEKGSVYDEHLINANRDEIRRKIALKDNPFIDVVVKIDFDKKKKLASIRYNVVERLKVFVERIDIVGNTRTLDRVIRREFSVHEGDALNVYKVQRTIEKLRAMGYFDEVEISEEEGSMADKKVLLVSVKEKESTAQIRMGLNVSDADGFGGFIGFMEHNLMGTGRVLSADISWMQRYRGGKIDLYDPRFMDQNFGAGVGMGGNSYDRKNIDQSMVKNIYVSPYVRYTLAENLYHTLRYTLSRNNRSHKDRDQNKKIRNITRLMEEEYGKYTCGEISSTLTYDKTDNFYDPRNGYELSMTNSYAGIIGNVSYFKNELGAKFYKAITERVTFIVDANLGYLKEIKGTRSTHRFSLGGDGISMRGFDSGGVGPRDKEDNSIGGTKYWTVSLMAKAPLSTKEIGIDGVLFIDFGSAWGTRHAHGDVHDSSSIRSSAGVAIQWSKSPLGVPLSFVFGFAIKKQPFDKKQTFTLTGIM
ncbi:MAG: outer membrane protein assembly factor BamA [Holosporaceae bacterium]|jgi:outer membrane protein insertion porin family|nr:outer membrane protein assembly factor BamA [Holosporaceae bacterium]